jgi:prohibitin 2
VDEVLLRDLHFSDTYAAAIEQKQISQQNAQRMFYVLQKAELEKKQKILEAQGEARSIQLKGRAIAQSARIVQYEYARKLAPNVTTIVTDGKSLPFSSKAPGSQSR